VRPLLARLRSVVRLLSQSNPTFQRWFLWPYYHNVHHREPQPYSTLLGAEEGIRHAQVAGDRLIQVSLTISQKAFKWFEMGDVEGAIRLLRETEKEARLVDGFVFEMARQTLARVLCEAGDEAALDEAVRLSQAAINKPGGASMFIGMAHHNLAKVLLKRKQPAVDEAEKGYKALEAAPLYCVDVAATLVTALVAQDKPEQALPVAEKALGVIATFGGAGYAEVEVRLAASEAFHAAGDRERANAELQETLRQIKLRTYDITDPTWRTSYLTRNPSCVRAQQLAAKWNVVET
jgi:ATP/maltotriose-dependent transcriptional regulator MalT